MESLSSLLSEYGILVYGVLFAYCALKSGALPLFAGYAAQTGTLDLLSVIAVTFAGGYLGDEVRFAVARRYGVRFLSRWSWAQRAMETAQRLMVRYGTLYIFLYRYPKGMRTIGALPVGLGDIAWARFTVLNAGSAVLWTGLMIGAGYLFGAGIERAVADNWGAASIVILAGFVILTVIGWRRINRQAETP